MTPRGPLLCTCFAIFLGHVLSSCQQYVIAKDGFPRALYLENSAQSSDSYHEIKRRLGIPLTPLWRSKPVCGVLPLSLRGPGKIYTSKDGHLTYELDSCFVRRLSADSARLCLDGKHVVFVGDDLSRSQYLALGYLLSRGHQLPRYHDDSVEPHLLVGSGWSDLQSFCQAGTEVLTEGDAAVVTELCICAQNPALPQSRRLCVDFAKKGLNCSAPLQQPVQSGAIKLGYTQLIGAANWQGALLKTVDAVLNEEHPPDLIILNAGYLLHHFASSNATILSEADLQKAFDNIFSKLLESIKSDNHAPKVLWQTATPEHSQDGNLMAARELLHNISTQSAHKHNIPVFDARTVAVSAGLQGLTPADLFWDGKSQYWPYLIQELNDLLLNSLCTGACEWSLAASGQSLNTQALRRLQQRERVQQRKRLHQRLHERKRRSQQFVVVPGSKVKSKNTVKVTPKREVNHPDPQLQTSNKYVVGAPKHSIPLSDFDIAFEAALQW